MDRTRGSHRQYKHPTKAGTVTVAGKLGVDRSHRNVAKHPRAGGTQILTEVSVRYTVILEQGKTSYGAYVADLPGCIAIGTTEAETLALIRKAIEFHLEGIRMDGEAVPEPRSSSHSVEVLA